MMESRSFRNYEIRGWVPKSLQRMVQVVVETVKQVPSSSLTSLDIHRRWLGEAKGRVEGDGAEWQEFPRQRGFHQRQEVSVVGWEMLALLFVFSVSSGDDTEGI